VRVTVGHVNRPVEDPRARVQAAVDQLQAMPALLEATIARAQSQSGEGSDHDQLVRVTLSAGGSDLAVSIDPSALDPLDPAGLAARIIAAYHEALQQMTENAAAQSGSLRAFAAGLSALHDERR
jgi:DNA-binding protein YbaB